MNALERAAALHAADHARDAAELRMLLDMLGLLPESITPGTAPSVTVLADVKHGTFLAYRKGCRCDDCRAANAEHSRRRRANAKADPSRADRAGHGNANTYRNHGCRCGPCCAAYIDYWREHNDRCQQVALREAS